MDAAYAYIWEYLVRPESIADFESAYGPDGDWARLFRRHAGYLRTDLLRDAENPARYVTIDWWAWKAAYAAFRTGAAVDFAALDARCERLTERETYLGELVAGRPTVG